MAQGCVKCYRKQKAALTPHFRFPPPSWLSSVLTWILWPLDPTLGPGSRQSKSRVQDHPQGITDIISCLARCSRLVSPPFMVITCSLQPTSHPRPDCMHARWWVGCQNAECRLVRNPSLENWARPDEWFHITQTRPEERLMIINWCLVKVFQAFLLMNERLNCTKQSRRFMLHYQF